MTHASFFADWVSLLRFRAAAQPNRIQYTFLRDGEQEAADLTCADLDLGARAIAAHLQQMGAPGDRALLVYQPGLDYLRAFFGCLYAGVIAVPAYPPRNNRHIDRLDAIIADSGARFALMSGSMVQAVQRHFQEEPAMQQVQLVATDAISHALADAWAPPTLGPDALAFLQYTSGSTGEPKGVMVTHANLLHNAAMMADRWAHTPDDLCVSWLPIFHDMGLIGTMLEPLYVGYRAVLMSPASFLQRPMRWLEAISRYRGTTSCAPNFAFDLCARKVTPAERARLDLRSWRIAVNGAEPVRAETLARFAAAFGDAGFRRETFVPGYGMAEATLMISSHVCERPAHICHAARDLLEQHLVREAPAESEGAAALVGCGPPGIDTTLAIVDPETRVRCGEGQVGEIWVAGPSVAAGYWNRPAATAETFGARTADTGEGPFLRTGDLGFLREGELFITGRLKDLLIIRGRNLYPQDIEATAERSHPALRPGCGAAFSVQTDGEERLVLVQEVYRHTDSFEPVVGAVRQALAEQHDAALHALVLIAQGTIPKTSSGKIQRRAAKKLFQERGLEVIYAFQAEAEVAAGEGVAIQPVAGPSAAEVEAWLVQQLAARLGLPPRSISAHQPFAWYGLDSAQGVELSGELAQWLGRSLPATLVWDYPTIAALSRFLAGDAAPREPVAPRAAASHEPVAIVGMGIRVPGATGPEQFWHLLRDGVDAITEVPPERWDVERLYHPEVGISGKMATRWGGFLDGVDQFDPQFFEISPREATRMDPQQRLLLEVCWEALEHAGIAPERLAGSRTGVYIGMSAFDYLQFQTGEGGVPDAYTGTGNAHSIAANRISYHLNLRGPSVAVDTACSSSLVAVHMACQSLRSGECTLAIAGGVNLILTPDLTIAFSQARMMAADGRCKPFDAAADGYVRGEGCGIVVLKRLSDALREGDRVLALLLGSAVNQDGRSNGLTAPNGIAQQEVIREALVSAGVAPAAVTYIEAHGTGTSLGDPIEVGALAAVFSEGGQSATCLIGSVKSNIGHLEAAAGIAGLLKVVLCLQYGQIPATLHLRSLNPLIDLRNTGLQIAAQHTAWDAGGAPRIAGVSSFGFGGTNCHVVVAEPPVRRAEAREIERSAHVLCLSARTESGLQALAKRYIDHLTTAPDTAFSDICYTANTGRNRFAHGLAVTAGSATEAHTRLLAWAAGTAQTGAIYGQAPRDERPRIGFLFTGQGAQAEGMARELYDTAPIFREAVDRCAELVRPSLDRPLQEVLFATASAELIHETQYTQPALFAVEYALAELWRSWGVTPDVVMGHSLGEYVAACVAGAISLEDGLRLVAIRGRLMQRLPQNGGMAAVLVGPERVAELKLPASVAIASINGPNSLVLSGERSAVEAAVDQLAAAEISARMLSVSHAFHSPLMEPILDAFEAEAARITYRAPSVPLVSNLTGQVFGPGAVPDASYWRRHLRETVQFYAGLTEMAALGCDLFLEIGPAPHLIGMGRRALPNHAATWLASLKTGATSDWSVLCESLGALFVRGAPVDWVAFDRPYRRQRVTLPTYPFERQRYWVQPTMQPQPPAAITPPRKGDDAVVELKRRDQSVILARLQSIVANLLHAPLAGVDVNARFLEMGADSLVLLEAIRAVHRTFGVEVTFRQLFEEYTTLSKLAAYISAVAPHVSEADSAAVAPTVQPAAPAVQPAAPTVQDVAPALQPAALAPAEGSTVERILAEQLRVMSQLMERQMEVLRGVRTEQVAAAVATAPPPPAPMRPSDGAAAQTGDLFAAYQPIDPGSVEGLTAEQQRFVEGLIDRYTKRTAKSRAWSAAYRPVLADFRHSHHFQRVTKEMHYLPVAARAQGARFWDIDGNEWLDLCMGFGINLFGHSPDFVNKAIAEQLEKGLIVGPQHEMAGEVAALICEMSGQDRASFHNSGTEAVMTAVRLARAVTGRHKIAIFAGSYHGHADAILAHYQIVGDRLQSVPMAPGVTPNMAADVLVLTYGSPESLQVIAEHAPALAAVLVEPVQSRRPDFQPGDYLKALRDLTAMHDIALIFDEMVTGFRIHPDGAQAAFGVQADLVTYGKVVGGGMPIGVVAGQARYMAAVDGGAWRFGDDSYPSARTTMVAGTFCRHPLAMAAARATLHELRRLGPSVYTELNRRSGAMIDALNRLFVEHDVPIKAVHYGSLFRFSSPVDLELFYRLLNDKGIYVWEGRQCMLSLAHTDADIQRIIQAANEAVEELQALGFLPGAALDGGRRSPGESALAFPLTPAQQEFWMLTQMGADASLAGNEAVVLDMRGPLRPDLLQQALQMVIDRHEALRTTFDPSGQQQVVHPRLTLEVPVVDLCGADVTERDRLVRELLTRENQRLFDLVNGPVIRCTILKLGAQQHLLALVLHHLAADGWSMGLMVYEASALYEGLCAGTAVQLSPPLQFREYVNRKMRAPSDEGSAAEAYWCGKFADGIPAVDLPTDHSRPALQTYRGAVERLRLDVGALSQLKRFGEQRGHTLFMTLVTLYATLIHRLSGQQDIVIGMPRAGRSMPGSDISVGHYVNFALLRSQAAPARTFAEHLASVQREVLSMHDYDEYPLASLTRKLNLARDLSRPVAPVAFNLERNMPLPSFGALKVGLYPHPISYAKYELFLNAMELEGELLMDFHYNADLFERATIRRWVKHFKRLLEGALSQPEAELTRLPLLTEAERGQILVDWNQTAVPFPPVCLHALVEEQVKRTPNAVAVLMGEERLTYEALDREANRLAHHLQQMGVGPDVPVGLCMERSPALVVALLAILKAGGAFVPLDTDAPTARIRQVLEDAGAPVCISTVNLRHRLPAEPARPLFYDADAASIAAHPTEPPSVAVSPAHMISVYYTSGSTGKPKGVVSTHAGWVNRMCWMQRHKPLQPGETVLQKTTLTFDDAAVEFFWPLMAGGRIAMLEPGLHKDPRAILDAAIRYQAVALQFVPSMLALFVEAITPADRAGLSHLRHVISSGEALRSDLAQQFQAKVGCLLHNQWGATEVSIDSTVHTCTAEEGRAGAIVSIGRPFDNNQVYVLDSHLEPVPIGVAGDLYLAGVGLARGYLGDPELTRAVFVANPFGPGDRMYRTGDRGYYRADGTLHFLGRLDDQVKIRGQRVELAEIEAVLVAHPAVRQCAVVAHKQPDGYRLAAYYEVRKAPGEVLPDGWGSPAALRAYLNLHLPDYMIPGRFIAMERLPVTTSGKLDRKELPDWEQERPDLEEALVEPRNPIERAIALIWEEVLGIERVGIYDTFFDLGGHSLDATRVISRLNRQFGLTLSLKTLFEALTVARLAEQVQERLAPSVEASADQIPRLPLHGVYAISHAQERFWFAYQFDPRTAYGLTFVTEIEGEIEVHAFTAAVQQLVRRHSILRTTFAERDGAVVQVVHEAMEVACPVFDLQGVAAVEQQRTVEQQVRAVVHTPIDVTAGPLMRTALFLLEPARSLMLVNIHPIAFDDWSTAVLLKDLALLYRTIVAGSDLAQQAMPLQYADFAVWQNEQLRSGKLQEQRAYWHGLLAGEPKAPALPSDFESAPAQPEPMVPQRLQLSRELTDALSRLALAQGATLYMALLTGLSIWLSRTTGETDIMVGSPLSGRHHPELEGVLGVLVNPVALRTDLSDNPTGLQVLDQVKQVTLGAHTHQDYPFHHIIHDLRLQGRTAPLYSVVLVLQNAHEPVLEYHGLRFREWDQHHLDMGAGGIPQDPTLQIDLHIEAIEQPEGLALTVTYNSYRFMQSSVVRFLTHLQQVLEQLVSEPTRRLSQYEKPEPVDLNLLFE